MNDLNTLRNKFNKSYNCNKDILKSLGDAWNGLGKDLEQDILKNGGIYWDGGFLPISPTGEFES